MIYLTVVVYNFPKFMALNIVKIFTLASCTIQASYLRELNRRGDSEAVIRLFESGQAGSGEASLGEYVKALVAVDRLRTSPLVQTLQVCLPSRPTSKRSLLFVWLQVPCRTVCKPL